MVKYFLAICIGLLARGELASGQSPKEGLCRIAGNADAEKPVGEQSVPQNFVPVPEGKIGWATEVSFEEPRIAGPARWVRAEYQMWWLKNAAPIFPLVTTGDPVHDPTAGAVGSSSTRVLFDGSNLNQGLFSGMRFTVGGWLDSENCWGVEASAFLILQRHKGFEIGSDQAGKPPLYVPVFLADFGSEGKFFISDPTVPFTGNVAMSSSTQLLGVEANILRNIETEPGVRVDFLFGFRYLNLQENLSLQAAAENDPANDIQGFLSERFGTRNDFYGAQIGARVECRSGRLSLDMVAKVALGSTRQVIDVAGFTALAGAGVAPALGVAPGNYPGAIFAQSSNIGHQEENHFTLVPHVQLKLGWDITWRLRALVSYDFLYWNNVVRPADQIDRNVNSAQTPLSPNFGNPVTPVAPAPMFNRAEFWAQGVSVGVEFRY